jgi:hypothetical protein
MQLISFYIFKFQILKFFPVESEPLALVLSASLSSSSLVEPRMSPPL